MKLRIKIVRNEAGEYMASYPSLPGCVSRGRTAKQAAERLAESIRGYIAALSNFVPDRVEYEEV